MKSVISIIIATLIMVVSLKSKAENFCEEPKIEDVEIVDKTEDTVYLDIRFCAQKDTMYIAFPSLGEGEKRFKPNILGLQLNSKSMLADYPLVRPVEVEDKFSTESLSIRLIAPETKAEYKLKYPLKVDWVSLTEINEPNYLYLDHLHDYVVYLIDYNSRSNYKKAKRLIDYILTKDPEFVDAYHELARYLMKTQGFGTNSAGVLQAEQVLLTAKDIAPEHANTRVLLGYVYSWQNRFEEALEEFNKAEEIGTDNLWLYTNWGQMYERKSEFDLAIEYYKKATEGDKPSNSYSRAMLFGYRYLSSLYIDEKMYQEASALNLDASQKFRDRECFKAKHHLVEALFLDNYEAVLNEVEETPVTFCKRINKELRSVANVRMWNQKADESNSSAEQFYRKATIANPDYVSLVRQISKYDFSITENVLVNLKTKKRGLNVKDAEGKSPLVSAILDYDNFAVENLLKSGAEVNNTYTENKITALIIAVAHNNLEVVKLLVKYGADVDYQMPGGYSALELAKLNGLTSIIDYLTKSNAT